MSSSVEYELPVDSTVYHASWRPNGHTVLPQTHDWWKEDENKLKPKLLSYSI